MKLIIALLRGFQLLFTVIVFALSVALIKGQKVGGAPIRQGYSAFAGALGLVVSIFGIVAIFVDSLASLLGGLVIQALDGLAFLALLAGGVIMALGLKGTKCSDLSTYYRNELIGGGNVKVKGQWIGWYAVYESGSTGIEGRCHENTAEVTFEFLACILFAATFVYSFLNRKKSTSSYGV